MSAGDAAILVGLPLAALVVVTWAACELAGRRHRRAAEARRRDVDARRAAVSGNVRVLRRVDGLELDEVLGFGDRPAGRQRYGR